jgi:hypothetical protein
MILPAVQTVRPLRYQPSLYYCNTSLCSRLFLVTAR